MEIDKSVANRISTLKDLPSLPHILVKLMEACNDENGSLSDITEILTNDPSLCSKVLRLVNSAYYGLGRRIEGIDQAVAYLGTHTVKNIAVCSAVYQAFNSNKRGGPFNLKLFWWHSLKSALLSKTLAGKMEYSSPDEAFVAGLLHDIGKLVLWVNFSEKYTEPSEKSDDQPGLIAMAENRLGATHSQIGAWLLDLWKFPSFVADSALYHHEPLERISDAFPLTKIVYAADKLSRETADGRADGIKVAGELFGFSEEEVIAFLDRSDEEVGEVARSFGIEIAAPENLDEDLTDNDREKQENLVQAVRDISLLLGTLRNLVSAREERDILKVVREGLQVLFDFGQIHFFLYDTETKVLTGNKIETDESASAIGDLSIPLRTGKSLLASCLVGGKVLDSFSSSDGSDLVITDEQMIRFLGTEGMLCLPMAAQGEYVGVVAIGLDRKQRSELETHFKLLEMLASEAALALRSEQLRKMQLRKIQSERAAASFALARKIVHEVNNPLGIMKNYLKILGIKLNDQGMEQDEIRILNEEINRVARILEGLSTLSDARPRKSAPVDVNALIKDLIKVTGESLAKERKVAVHLDLDPGLPKMMSEKDSLKQIFINLVKNASEAMTEGGNLFIKTRYLGTPVGNGKDHGFVQITVSDDGPGISDEIKSRLFEPFVSSKGGGHSGLGLSIVLNLVNGLNGSIVCESEQGKGTYFKLELPVAG